MNKWIQKMKLKKGALHRSLGISQDKTIPMSVIDKKEAAFPDNMTPAQKLLKKRMDLAKTLKKMKR